MSASAQPLFANLPENVVSLSVSRRVWNGVAVEGAEWRGHGAVIHPFPHLSETRLVALLDEVGSPCEARLNKKRPCPLGYTPQHMDFLPAELEVWGFSKNVRYVRDVTLLVDFATLEERLGTRFDRSAVSAPRLRFQDKRIWPLMRMLSDAIHDRDPSAQLYGDGLITAIAARLSAEHPDEAPVGKGLAPWQLRRATEFLDAHLSERIDLADVAAQVGLSQSHFSRSFKASTGVPPYRWQLNARIGRAQALLLDSEAGLDDVAERTGFADAVHLGRTFRKLTGATPAAWRRERKDS